MAHLLGLARRLQADEDAAMAAESVLMAMLVAVACVAAVSAFASSLAGLFRGAGPGLG